MSSSDPFRLTFDPSVRNSSGKYPHGYWYAYSEVTEAEGEGPDPLTAVSTLALEMERLWAEKQDAEH